MSYESAFWLVVNFLAFGFATYMYGHHKGRLKGWADATHVWQNAYYSRQKCPCGGDLIRGPRGGMSQNATCALCGERYNLTPLGLEKL
jgi:hypothetical protein